MDEDDGIVRIWTDGGCRPNPGPGGWGAVLRCKGIEKLLKGGEKATTNNRMELTGALAALESLTRPCRVQLGTDSMYVRNGITTWHKAWIRNGWKTKTGNVLNRDLWERLLTAAERHQIEWKWVKGHVGHAENELADRLATEGREEVERLG